MQLSRSRVSGKSDISRERLQRDPHRTGGFHRVASRVRARRWTPGVAVYAVILLGSAIPGSSLAATPPWISIAGHAGEYALLAVVLRRSWRAVPASGFAVIVVATVLGVVNELQQSLVPGRVPDPSDVAVDMFGALIGVALATLRDARGPTWWTATPSNSSPGCPPRSPTSTRDSSCSRSSHRSDRDR